MEFLLSATFPVPENYLLLAVWKSWRELLRGIIDFRLFQNSRLGKKCQARNSFGCSTHSIKKGRPGGQPLLNILQPAAYFSQPSIFAAKS